MLYLFSFSGALCIFSNNKNYANCSVLAVLVSEALKITVIRNRMQCMLTFARCKMFGSKIPESEDHEIPVNDTKVCTVPLEHLKPHFMPALMITYACTLYRDKWL